MRTIKLLFLLIIASNITFGQGCLTGRGEHSIVIGFGGAWNTKSSAIAGGVVVSLWGRLDLGLSRDITSNSVNDYGAVSEHLTLYLLRSEKDHLYLGLSYLHSQRLTGDRQYTLPYPVNAYVLSIGGIASPDKDFSFVPSINLGLAAPVNAKQGIMLGIDLPFYFPILESSGIVPVISYAFISEVHNLGVSINYQYRL